MHRQIMYCNEKKKNNVDFKVSKLLSAPVITRGNMKSTTISRKIIQEIQDIGIHITSAL